MPSTSFNPSLHGFHFSNNDIRWSFGPLEGRFLCGGMAYAALDYFYNRMSIPPDTTAPAEGAPLHSYIYDRQVTAHVNTGAKFGGSMIPIVGPIVSGSIDPESAYNNLSFVLSNGTPTPFCLVSSLPFRGHHIVATGCSSTPPRVIAAYDPNRPEVVVFLQQLGSGKFQHNRSGELWDTFFVDGGYSVKTPSVLTGQGNWRWCRNCQGLFFFGHARNGICPVGGSSHDVVGSGGGVHTGGSSGNYILAVGTGTGQQNWRRCSVCNGLFFAGNNSLGVCPGNPNGHNGTSSGNYFLVMASG